MSSDISRVIRVKTSDEVTFELSEEAASLSQTIKHLIEDGCGGSVIPLPEVESSAMEKVIEYSNHHAKGKNEAGNDDFDKEFFESVKANQKMLYDLLVAANYLNNRGLLDLLCQGFADMIKGKSPEQIRQTFHIKSDFSPEEEEVVRKENAWAYD